MFMMEGLAKAEPQGYIHRQKKEKKKQSKTTCTREQLTYKQGSGKKALHKPTVPTYQPISKSFPRFCDLPLIPPYSTTSPASFKNSRNHSWSPSLPFSSVNTASGDLNFYIERQVIVNSGHHHHHPSKNPAGERVHPEA